MTRTGSRSVRARVWRWIACLWVGIVAAAAYASLFDDVWRWNPAQLVFNAFYFTAVFTGLAYLWLFRLTWPRWARYKHRVRWLWGLAAMGAGALLSLALGGIAQPVNLEAVATGQRNSAAQASEVWLLAARWSDGTSVPLSQFEPSGPWEHKTQAWGAWPEALTSLQEQPAALRWSGRAHGALTLTFVAHPWSGQVLVRWNGDEQSLDLYSPHGSERTLTLSPAMGGISLLTTGLSIACALSLGMLFLGASVLLLDRASRWSVQQSRRWSVSAALSGVVGLCAAVCLDNYLMRVWVLPTPVRMGVLLGLATGMGWLAHAVLTRLIWPRFSALPKPARVWWCIGALCASALLIAVVPITLYPPFVKTVEILATGQKNPASHGVQVWIHSVKIGDSDVPLTSLEQIGTWRTEYRMLLSDSGQPAVLKWSGLTNARDLTITFASQNWSGIALVRWQGGERWIDLYDTRGGPNLKQISVPIEQGTWDTLLLVVLYLAGAVSLGATALAAMVWLTTLPVTLREVSLPRLAWLYYALPGLVIWGFWLLAFWPGLLSADPLSQWEQILRGQFNDWHPVSHTLTMWLFTRVWLSPGVVAAFQVVALALVVGWGLMQFERWGLPRSVCWAISLLFALSPANSGMVIWLTKDTLYSIAFLAFVLLVLRVVVSKGRALGQGFGWLVLGGSAALVALYRHNGSLPAFGTLLMLLIAYRSQWRRVGLALLVSLGVWLGVRGPLYGVLGVDSQTDKSSTSVWMTFVVHQIAAHLALGTPLTEAEHDLLSQIDPEPEKWSYKCDDVMPILSSATFNVSAMQTHSSELLNLWWALLLRRPQVIVDHMVCSASGVWRVSAPRLGRYETVPIWGQDGQLQTVDTRFPHLKLARQPFLPSLTMPLAEWIDRSRHSDLAWLLWRPALWLYLAILGAIVAWLRSQRWQYLLVILPVILNSLIIAVYSTNFRYQYPAYVVGQLVSWFLLFGVPLIRCQDCVQ